MAVGDVYEVTDVQDFLGKVSLNVYFYQQRAVFAPLSGTIAAALAEEFADTIVPIIANAQHVSLVHREVRVRNLFDVTDAGTAISGHAGEVTGGGDATSPFVAFSTTLNHDNPAVGDGAKRFAGVYESGVAGGVASAATLLILDAVEDALEQPITGGLIIEDDIMFPVVVGRVRSGVSGAYEYRLPENSGELVVGTVIEALVKAVLGSQNSRKLGVGI